MPLAATRLHSHRRDCNREKSLSRVIYALKNIVSVSPWLTYSPQGDDNLYGQSPEKSYKLIIDGDPCDGFGWFVFVIENSRATLRVPIFVEVVHFRQIKGM